LDGDRKKNSRVVEIAHPADLTSVPNYLRPTQATYPTHATDVPVGSEAGRFLPHETESDAAGARCQNRRRLLERRPVLKLIVSAA
jgi:hypothetical protein